MKRPPFFALIVGSGFGSGFWPWGPGTAGALLATLIWVGLCLCGISGTTLMLVTLVLVLLFTLLGTWATAQLQPFWGEDPSRVVVDEMVGVWIPLLAVDEGNWLLAFLSFALFRFFDILKPLGIRALDRRVGAFWVMADDILAGVYSLIVILLLRWVM